MLPAAPPATSPNAAPLAALPLTLTPPAIPPVPPGPLTLSHDLLGHAHDLEWPWRAIGLSTCALSLFFLGVCLFGELAKRLQRARRATSKAPCEAPPLSAAAVSRQLSTELSRQLSRQLSTGRSSTAASLEREPLTPGCRGRHGRQHESSVEERWGGRAETETSAAEVVRRMPQKASVGLSHVVGSHRANRSVQAADVGVAPPSSQLSLEHVALERPTMAVEVEVLMPQGWVRGRDALPLHHVSAADDAADGAATDGTVAECYRKLHQAHGQAKPSLTRHATCSMRRTQGLLGNAAADGVSATDGRSDALLRTSRLRARIQPQECMRSFGWSTPRPPSGPVLHSDCI